MNFYHFLSKLFPEGKKKNKLRKIFYKISNSIVIGSKEIRLDKDRKIYGRFYKLLLVRYSDCLEELRGYIKHYIPKKGDVIVDVGAFYGVFTVYASKLVGEGGKVIVFEPDEANYNLLKKNVKLNGLKNVILFNKGLWDKNSFLKFKNKGPESCLAEFDREENVTEKIEVARLDDIFKKLGIDRLNFIKMDIEGSEIKALDGMKKIMKKNKINFAVASYHEINREKTYKKLEKIFKKQGYKTVTEYPKHLTTYAWKN